MGKDISFMQYMRAHGNTPGPTQRPLLTGATTGFLAAVPSSLLLYYSGAAENVSAEYSASLWLLFCFYLGLKMLAGMIYAAVFKRAANDRKGGWLFGISYGFLIWMITPVTLWQLVAARPIVVGNAAIGLFAAHLIYGFLLGIGYPHVHRLLQKKLSDDAKGRNVPDHNH